MNKTIWNGLKKFLLFYVGINLLVGFVTCILLFSGVNLTLGAPVIAAMLLLCYWVFRKKLTPGVFWMNLGILMVFALALAVCMKVFDGSLLGVGATILGILSFPFFPVYVLFLLMGSWMIYFGIVLALMLLSVLASFLLQWKQLCTKKVGLCLAVMLCFVMGTSYFSYNCYQNRPQVRYAGHGFQYMNGYSSTDFTDYMVYSESSKLVELDHTASVQITNKDEMPVMDGAEACYPVYAAIAKACYVGIEEIEKTWLEYEDGKTKNTNGDVVTFTNTVVGFDRLLLKEVDLLFSARPSKAQQEEAANQNIELEITPIGKEAFVFFVEEDNPVENLTSEQIRGIYHGDITNWSEVGGKDEPIVAFQRPANSGSQSMMEYFMGDVTLKEPKSYEYVDSMVGVIKETAQYANEDGAMGYSFRYFVEELNNQPGVKIVSVDGVAPTVENIENGTYPLSVGLCLVSRKDDPNPNVQKMIDFCLSEDGQYIIRKTGYAGLK